MTQEAVNPPADRFVCNAFLRVISYVLGMSPEVQDKSHKEWLDAHDIGDPQATEACSVEELRRGGLVGVYKRV